MDMQQSGPHLDPSALIPNVATLLERNTAAFGDHLVFAGKHDGAYEGISWNTLLADVRAIAHNLRAHYGFLPGDKLVIFSPNRSEMLRMELAVMASGGIAVPIFAFFHKETAELLIRHSDARFLAVAGELQLERLDPELPLDHVFSFDAVDNGKWSNLVRFSELLASPPGGPDALFTDADPDALCLNMYTSGTMGTPKCVQLSHRNILSQQAALAQLWDLGPDDRFLSYLPWHHSFGGIFELFTALRTGATLHLESGYGKDPQEIMANWKLVRPTVFFSVPKVYQALVDLTHHDAEAERLFFHAGLKFIFTAAAALPQKLSEEFERRGVPVIEGWGLTETSPCCTLTDPAVKRAPGVVGKPLPGITLRLADDGEVLVKGPNVMCGYYKNDEANKGLFDADGFFHTGDVGELLPDGLKLITRKDRIFKLSNGEKVIPSDLEKLIEFKCHYISFAMVVGSGQEYPIALLFPNKKQLEHPDYRQSPMEGCFCPRSLDELGKCLHGCLHDANCGIGQKFAKIKAAMIIDGELSLANNTLTPSMKVAPRNVVEVYRAHLENLYGANHPLDEEVYIIKLDDITTAGRKIIA
ncbi:MAG: AMP-binding protein [Flavobacteriales bacterium]|jgi:long-subunit acyl-CoA synthetase (AMP-forming)|nr:AMP-binding protein [Flavobacteriales bacterium]